MIISQSQSQKNKHQTIKILIEKLTLITKWLRDLGLSVNESKTEVCIFYHENTPNIKIVLNNVTIK